MIQSAYHIGTIWGIPIKIHISLFILLAYISLYAFFTGIQQYGFVDSMMQVIAVLILQVFFFISIGLHELGHAFVAIRKGSKVREITLMIIGGAAMMEDLPRRPKDEALMAAAGPIVSTAISLLFGTIALLLLTQSQAGGLGEWLTWLCLFTAVGNGILAIFNMLPAYPMDGGRILRAILTPHFGRLRATHIAVVSGRVIAVLLGIIAVVGIPPWIKPWHLPLMLIAGFVFMTGKKEYQQIQIETLMEERGFAPKSSTYGPRRPPPPIDDHTVLVSPPPYEKDGEYDRAHVEKVSRKRSPFF